MITKKVVIARIEAKLEELSEKYKQDYDLENTVRVKVKQINEHCYNEYYDLVLSWTGSLTGLSPTVREISPETGRNEQSSLSEYYIETLLLILSKFPEFEKEIQGKIEWIESQVVEAMKI